MKDLQELLKENPSDDIKKDISECLKKAVEQRKKLAEEQKIKAEQAAKAPAPKIVEQVETPGEFKKVQIDENSDDSDDTEALKKLKSNAKGKTKTIDQATLNAAKQKAAEIDKA